MSWLLGSLLVLSEVGATHPTPRIQLKELSLDRGGSKHRMTTEATLPPTPQRENSTTPMQMKEGPMSPTREQMKKPCPLQ